ncbi:MAG TPA: VOC family protein [Candidatus Acidoferrales bacterium]|nr:VOC family protein [Candidatus Acidoferrales bacterium]
MLRPRKLGHVGVFVKDLERSKKFYTEVVGLKVSDELPGRAVFMRCGHDHHDTVLFQLPPEKAGRSQNDRVELQQISYEVDRLDDLRQKAAELRAQGMEVAGPQQRGPGMDKTIDFSDPDGNTIQFYCDMDQVGWDDRSRPPEQWDRKPL